MKFSRFLCRLIAATVACLCFGPVFAQQKLEAVHGHAGEEPWWRNAVIYEIYVRSFQDSNGDGVGDLRGVIQRLDYLQQLGVDAIWLTPIFPSPQMDLGYDISDYCAIDPLFGTLADMQELIAKAKARHIRVLLDLVLNHTSDQHPWFQASRSLGSPKRDWYIWRDGKPGADEKPPNNWLDRTDDSAWEYDSRSRQYYYHYFAKQQPDLNWRNPEVQKAMFSVVDFWLKQGIAGFRLDAVNMLFEDPQFRDEPRVSGTNEYGEPAQSQTYQRGLPEVHDVMRGLRQTVNRFPGDPVLVGEVYTADPQEVMSWYGTNQDELQLPMNTSVGFVNRRDAAQFRKRMSSSDALPAADTPLLVTDNHDNRRSMDRYADGTHDEQIAKTLATILLASRGSALVYQGQEIGMRTSTPTRKEDVRDPRGIAAWPRVKGRDGERTPMQWNTEPNAGFTTGKPWLTTPASNLTAGVEGEHQDHNSLLNWYIRLNAFRYRFKALHDGTQQLLDEDDKNVLAWIRRPGKGIQGEDAVLVLCNLSANKVSLDLHDVFQKGNIAGKTLSIQADSLHSDVQVRPANAERLTLEPFQVLIETVN